MDNILHKTIHMEKDFFSGMTSEKAKERLSKEGYNELPTQKKQNVFVMFYNVIKEPMLLLLLCAGLIYLALGEPKDAAILSTFIIVVIGITFYQEKKTERALEALKSLSSPMVLVMRDGEQKQIPGRELVREDIFIIREGDRVPADSVVLSATNLSVNESLLTGESVAVAKTVWDGQQKIGVPGGENLPFIYSGTMIVQGHAVARALSTGVNTEIGKIGKSLHDIVDEETLLQKETVKIVKKFATIGGLLCLVVVLVYGIFRNAWLKGILTGLTLGMSMLPEEFSVVMIIFFAMGAWRMSRRNVLVRKAAVIETLGAATILCVDKTGTLTMNQMRFGGMMVGDKFFEFDGGGVQDLPDAFNELLECSALASQSEPFDPIEKEIKSCVEKYLTVGQGGYVSWNLTHEYPLSRNLLALSHVWQSPENKECVVATKGAPEAIISLCHLEGEKAEDLMVKVRMMSDRGLRVLGVAKASFGSTGLPSDQHDFDFEFVGLIGFIDPIRSTVADSVRECYTAGIRVVMITGDYPGTAMFIAKKIGLKNSDKFITGDELSKLSSKDLQERIKDVNIFARVVPEQKLILVNAFKANGEIVAMTGDGVNDAPALKSAHIGVAMGENGTDVAREASDIVVLNDDFSSIVKAVRLGRSIYDNLRKSMSFIFAVHVPIAGITMLPVLTNMPIVLFPVHVAFLELIIDPACSVVFESEKEESDIMDRPPRKLNSSLFSSKFIIMSLLQGLSVWTVSYIVYLTSIVLGYSEGGVRSLTFATIVFGNIMLIITNLSHRFSMLSVLRRGNKAMLWVVAMTFSCLVLVLSVPALRALFHFDEIGWSGIALSLMFGIISVLWFEFYKKIRLKKER